MADDGDGRAAFLCAARRQALAGEMVALFRGTAQENAAKKLAKVVAGSADDAELIVRMTGRRNTEVDEEMRLARQRAEHSSNVDRETRAWITYRVGHATGAPPMKITSLGNLLHVGLVHCQRHANPVFACRRHPLSCTPEWYEFDG